MILEVDPAYFRPADVEELLGDPAKARKELGWVPEYDLKGIVEDMVESDIRLLKKESVLQKSGFTAKGYYE